LKSWRFQLWIWWSQQTIFATVKSTIDTDNSSNTVMFFLFLWNSLVWKHTNKWRNICTFQNGFHPPTGWACVLSVTEMPRWRMATYCGQYLSWRLSCHAAMHQQVVEIRSWSKCYYSVVVTNTPTLWTNYLHFSFYFTFSMTPDRTSRIINASNFVKHKTSSPLRFSRVGLRSSSIRTFATLVSVQTSIFTTDRELSQDAFQSSKYSFTFLAYANFTAFY
jgi:hypothetical protein